MREVKITGIRSIHAKLERLAAELEDDSARIRTYGGRDGKPHDGLQLALERVAADMRLIAHGLEVFECTS